MAQKLNIEESKSSATAETSLDAAYSEVTPGVFHASVLTRGPWNPDHQHAGPPSALMCRAVERVALNDGLTHLGRLTVNLIRPAPIGECRVEVATDYVGRNTGHYSGRFIAGGKECARFTALMQRESDAPIPAGTPSHPPPHAPKAPDQCPVVKIPFAGAALGYGHLVAKYVFINGDLTINLFRRPEGEWICLESRSLFGGNGCGLAESALYDERGMIGRATQSLTVRPR
jgi:hypothetical protein